MIVNYKCAMKLRNDSYSDKLDAMMEFVRVSRLKTIISPVIIRVLILDPFCFSAVLLIQFVTHKIIVVIHNTSAIRLKANMNAPIFLSPAGTFSIFYQKLLSCNNEYQIPLSDGLLVVDCNKSIVYCHCLQLNMHPVFHMSKEKRTCLGL